MGFVGRLGFGWQLGLASLRVVGRDKTLMLFPVLSAVSGVLLLGALWAGIGPERLAAWARHARLVEEATGQLPVLFWVMSFALYMALSFITVYFNVALLGAAQQSMAGRDTTVGDGLRVANAHLGKIFVWSLITGTVGLLLHMLERNGKLGSFVRSLLGTAWAVITYFVAPVMIFEGRSPTQAIGRSVSLMKSTWGENAAAQVGIGLVTTTMVASVVALAVLAMAYLPALAVVLIPLLLPLGIGVLLLGLAAKAVLAVGLYEYATQTSGSGVFPEAELRGAFQ